MPALGKTEAGGSWNWRPAWSTKWFQESQGYRETVSQKQTNKILLNSFSKLLWSIFLFLFWWILSPSRTLVLWEVLKPVTSWALSQQNPWWFARARWTENLLFTSEHLWSPEQVFMNEPRLLPSCAQSPTCGLRTPEKPVTDASCFHVHQQLRLPVPVSCPTHLLSCEENSPKLFLIKYRTLSPHKLIVRPLGECPRPATPPLADPLTPIHKT